MLLRRCLLSLSVLVSFMHAYGDASAHDASLISALDQCIHATPEQRQALVDACLSQSSYLESLLYHDGGIALYTAFPSLQKNLPHMTLCTLPTPIQKLDAFGAYLGLSNLYCKRDDLCGGYDEEGMPLYGGNKVRKLEFLFPDAVAHGADSIFTMGAAGSNHSAATAFWAHEQGLACTLFLRPQHRSYNVLYNLLLDKVVGANVIASETREERAQEMVKACCKERISKGRLPYCIPIGGSTPLGIVGLVNAAFELRDQVQQGLMPEPDYIYVALGSAGTAAGLILGCKLAGLKTRVKAVAVEPDTDASWRTLINDLIVRTNSLLHDADAQVPVYAASDFLYDVVASACGDDYGLLTAEGAAARDSLFACERIRLEGCYTAKACAGIMHDLEQLQGTDPVVLFWNTFSCPVLEPADFKELLDAMPHPCLIDLPEMLRCYFDQPVQEIDRLLI